MNGKKNIIPRNSPVVTVVKAIYPRRLPSSLFVKILRVYDFVFQSRHGSLGSLRLYDHPPAASIDRDTLL